LKPIPGFDSVNFPYLITRTSQHINLLDMGSRRTYQIIADTKPDFDNEFMSVINDSRGKIYIMFTSKDVTSATHDNVKVLKVPR